MKLLSWEPGNNFTPRYLPWKTPVPPWLVATVRVLLKPLIGRGESRAIMSVKIGTFVAWGPTKCHENANISRQTNLNFLFSPEVRTRLYMHWINWLFHFVSHELAHCSTVPWLWQPVNVCSALKVQWNPVLYILTNETTFRETKKKPPYKKKSMNTFSILQLSH